MKRLDRRGGDQLSSLKSGFTLLEVVIGASIVIGLIGLVYRFQTQMAETQLIMVNRHLSTQAVDALLTKMVKEIRNAQYGENQNYPLVTAAGQELTFFADSDYDQTVERIRYFLGEQGLFKGIIKPDENNQYLPENEEVNFLVEAGSTPERPVFLYYNSDWPMDTESNPLTDPVDLTEVKMIEVNLDVDGYQLSSFASIRQLKKEESE